MRLMVMPVGRRPGFFPITGEKYFLPCRSQAKPILVFSGSQAKTISYSTEHRQKLFRTIPITCKKYFVLYRKDISVSTSWWEVANHIRYGIRFTVRILGGITHYLSLIAHLRTFQRPA